MRKEYPTRSQALTGTCLPERGARPGWPCYLAILDSLPFRC